MKPVYCNGCGAIFSQGIFSSSTHIAWEVNQTGPEDIKREQVLPVPLPTFGRLNMPDKLAFSAAALTLDGKTDISSDKSGICIAIPYGTLTTDMFFMESIVKEFPSPSYFSATLPSSAIADIAIYFKFKGPDRVFSGGNNPVVESISSSLRLIKSGKADHILALAVWALDKSHKGIPSDLSRCENAAFGFLFSSAPKVQSSPQIDISIKDNHLINDQFTELQLCIRLLDLVRENEKTKLFLTHDNTDNYISLT
jgi:hypothetical protein